jgi:hypothetical protein
MFTPNRLTPIKEVNFDDFSLILLFSGIARRGNLANGCRRRTKLNEIRIMRAEVQQSLRSVPEREETEARRGKSNFGLLFLLVSSK